MLGKHCRNIVAFAFRLEKYIKHAEYHSFNDMSVIQFEICENTRVSLR